MLDGDLIVYAGLASAFEEPVRESDKEPEVKRRVKMPRRQIDWPAFFKLLNNSGIDDQRIEELTGLPKATITGVKRDHQIFQYGDRVMALLGLFTMNLGRNTVPLLGDYHEFMDKDK